MISLIFVAVNKNRIKMKFHCNKTKEGYGEFTWRRNAANEAIGMPDKFDEFINIEWASTDYKKYESQLTALHTQNFYGIGLFVSGKGKYIANFKEYDLNSPALLLFAPGQLHSFKSLLVDCDILFITFSEGFFSTAGNWSACFFKYNLFRFFSVLYLKKEESIKKIFQVKQELLAEYEKDSVPAHCTYMASLLSQLLCCIIRTDEYRTEQKERPATSSMYNMFFEFTNSLEQNFRELHTVKEYANTLQTTLKTLELCTYEVAKKTPLKMINERIIKEACNLLQTSAERPSKIAGYLGFEDYSYFVKFFKRHIRLTPSKYREFINQVSN